VGCSGRALVDRSLSVVGLRLGRQEAEGITDSVIIADVGIPGPAQPFAASLCSPRLVNRLGSWQYYLGY